MATGEGSGIISLERGSTFLYDVSCFPCLKEETNVEAIKYCVECNERLCSTCLKSHNRFEKMSNHQLLDDVPKTAKGDDVPKTAKGQGASPPIPKEKCPIHHGRAIDMYCGTHDVVCCVDCILVSHRPCQCVDFIHQVANTVWKGQEVNDVKLATNKVTSGMEKIKRGRSRDLNRIEQQRRIILTQIKDVRESINKQLDVIENTAKDQLRRRYQKFEEQIKADLKALGDMIATLQTKATEIRTFDGDNESQLFVYVKQAKVSIKEGDILMQEMEKSAGKETLSFVVNSKITDTICNIKSFGKFIDNESFTSVSLKGQYNVKANSDRSTCDISGSCFLEDGSILMTDTGNKKVKQLDQSYTVISECNMPCRVTDVCRTGPSEVAIALFDDKKVQFATATDKISLTRSFRVHQSCRCLAYSKGQLFVSCGGQVDGKGSPGQIEVYNTEGTLIRSFQKDATGKKHLFSLPLHLTASLNGENIHIADCDNGVITMNIDEKQRVFTYPELKNAIGVCVKDDESLLVCGLDSHNILQIGTDGRKEAVLLREKDEIRFPTSLLYDTANARLIVTMKDLDHINVYDISSCG